MDGRNRRFKWISCNRIFLVLIFSLLSPILNKNKTKIFSNFSAKGKTKSETLI